MSLHIEDRRFINKVVCLAIQMLILALGNSDAIGYYRIEKENFKAELETYL